MLYIPSVNSKYSSKATFNGFERIERIVILFGFGIENRVFGTASFSGTLVLGERERKWAKQEYMGSRGTVSKVRLGIGAN